MESRITSMSSSMRCSRLSYMKSCSGGMASFVEIGLGI